MLSFQIDGQTVRNGLFVQSVIGIKQISVVFVQLFHGLFKVCFRLFFRQHFAGVSEFVITIRFFSIMRCPAEINSVFADCACFLFSRYI